MQLEGENNSFTAVPKLPVLWQEVQRALKLINSQVRPRRAYRLQRRSSCVPCTGIC